MYPEQQILSSTKVLQLTGFHPNVGKAYAVL